MPAAEARANRWSPGARLAIVLAVSLLGGAASLDGQSYVSRVNKGTEALNKKDYVKAVQLLSDSENADRSRPEAPAALGWAFHALGLFEEGLSAFERALAIREAPLTLKGAVFCSWELKRYGEMLPRATRWSAIAPADAEAVGSLGLALLYNDRFGEAIEVLERATSMVRSAMFDGWLAEAYLAVGRYADADRVAGRGAAAATLQYETWLLDRWRGLAAIGRGDPGTARRVLGGPSLAAGVAQQPDRRALRVRWVVPSGPAGRAGLRPGDMIQGFDDQLDMSEFSDLIFDTQVRRSNWGRSMVLRVDRGGTSVDVPVVLAFEDANAPAAGPPPLPPSVAAEDPASEAAMRQSAATLTVLGVRVEPGRVKQGQAFRVTVTLLLRGASARTPVTLRLSIVQSGQALATTTVETEVPPGEPWEVSKDIPRAAGAPGLYTVEVLATAGALEQRGEALLVILGG
jgi:tetratricopeptide (TPR) repeat protein